MTQSGSGRPAPRTAFDFCTPGGIPGPAVAGAAMVRELPAELGLLAWRVLRCVLLWAAETAEGRDALFPAAPMARWEEELLESPYEAALANPLAVLVGELSGGADADPEHLAWASLCVTEWALARRHHATALAFAEAAALAWPDHPRYAWTAGRLLRALGRAREAEAWLRRSMRLAVGRADWEAQARSLASLGNLFLEHGNLPRARSAHTVALRVARRHRLRETEAMALHDLFVVALAAESPRADDLARRAFLSYGAGHPRLPALAHDLATLWIARGEFASARAVLTALDPHFTQPRDRLRLATNLARSAAGACVWDVYRRFRAEAMDLLKEADPERMRTAPALLQLACAADDAGEGRDAERLLERARADAEAAGEMDVAFRAEAMLAEMRSREGGVRGDGAPRRTPVRQRVSRLAVDMAAALDGAAAP